MTLDALLKHPAVWRGRQQHTDQTTLASGFDALDNSLPGRGWPVGALTELMVAHEGVGEFTLLQPTLAALTQRQQWIALVAPPHTPYAPALLEAGIDLRYLLIIDADVEATSSTHSHPSQYSGEDSGRNSGGYTSKNHKKRQPHRFWAAEQLLRSGIFSAVLLWSDHTGDERQQRRLQLAAEHGKAWAVCYRSLQAAHNSSPAGLRMVLLPQQRGRPKSETPNSQYGCRLNIDIIKNRGGRLHNINLCLDHGKTEALPPTDNIRPLCQPAFASNAVDIL